MTNRLLIFLIIGFYTPLIAQEYFINIKKGWQLIGLPTDIDNMRVFNNKNVRLVWNYDAKYSEWVAYSPDKTTRNSLDDKNVNALNSVKRWQGLWIYSYNDWDLAVEDEVELRTDRSDINSIQLYKGWNLISLPFNTVLSAKIFDGYRLWRYGEFDSEFKSNWQTNQSYSYLNFPEVDEINSKSGFWVHSPEDRDIDLAQESAKFSIIQDSAETAISSFKSYDEIETHIKNSLVISQREGRYWSWTTSEDIHQTQADSEIEEFRISNSITNKNEPNVDYLGVNKPDILKENDGYIFYRSGDKKTVLIEHLDNIIFNRINPIKFTPTFDFGNSYIDNFIVSNNRLIIISKLTDTKQNPSFADRCRENKTVISIYELTFDNILTSPQKHIFIDGNFNESRVINNNLYILTKFKPCAELDYTKEFLSNSDLCSYPPFDTIDYQNSCYDVIVDNESGKRFRFDYENPILQNLYTFPKYEAERVRYNLITPETFFASTKMDQDSSLLTISHIDTISGNMESSSTIFGESKNIYISENNIYFTSDTAPHYISFRDFKAKSDIHKFSYYPTVEYQASGTIKGEVINRFSLSEENQNLRVASRDYYSWGEKSDQNRIEVFQTRDEVLESIGSLINVVNSPYTLEGVKFYGDIAIASTNSLNQPLQLIDLKNSTVPIKAGTLDILGTSEYIHYLKGENRLISFGREISETGVKGGIEMNILNIYNTQKPMLEKRELFGDYYNFTPIFENPKAFGYRESDNILTIPLYQDGGKTSNTFSTGLHLFKINKLDTGVTSVDNLSYLPYLSVPTITKYINDGRTMFVDRENRTDVIFVTQGKLNVKRIK